MTIWETHYAIRYTNLSTGESHTTDYGPNRDTALAAYRPRIGPGYREELITRKVGYGAWSRVPRHRRTTNARPTMTAR